MRQIVLDTETTGLETSQGHRIIEIGCVELLNRKLTGQHYHQYINPQREIDQGAIEVHGITNEFLADKPLFEQISDEFMRFIEGAELIIHNAPFDVGFLNAELDRLAGRSVKVDSVCQIIDTLLLARKKHPGQRNNLDALCSRYMVDNSQRDLHGALLDAEILADVYLAMTGGQTMLHLGSSGSSDEGSQTSSTGPFRLPAGRAPLRVIRASESERAAHDSTLDQIADMAGGEAAWKKLGLD